MSHGSLTTSESNRLGLRHSCRLDDLLKINEQNTQGSEKIPALPHHHQNQSIICRLKCAPPLADCVFRWKTEDN